MKVLHPDIAEIITPGEGQRALTGWAGKLIDQIFNGMDFKDRRDPARVAWALRVAKVVLCTLSSTSYTKTIHPNPELQELVLQLEVYVGRLKTPTA